MSKNMMVCLIALEITELSERCPWAASLEGHNVPKTRSSGERVGDARAQLCPS